MPVVVRLENVAVGGVGIFNVLPDIVAVPVPIVVNVMALCLLLNVFQSAEAR